MIGEKEMNDNVVEKKSRKEKVVWLLFVIPVCSKCCKAKLALNGLPCSHLRWSINYRRNRGRFLVLASGTCHPDGREGVSSSSSLVISLSESNLSLGYMEKSLLMTGWTLLMKEAQTFPRCQDRAFLGTVTKKVMRKLRVYLTLRSLKHSYDKAWIGLPSS